MNYLFGDLGDTLGTIWFVLMVVLAVAVAGHFFRWWRLPGGKKKKDG